MPIFDGLHILILFQLLFDTTFFPCSRTLGEHLQFIHFQRGIGVESFVESPHTTPTK